jgi:hypothetical protein
MDTTSCLIFLVLLAGRIHLTSAQVELCSSTDDQFDVKTLLRQNWYIRVEDPKLCVGSESTSQCEVYFSVCGPLPPAICNNAGNDIGICQQVTIDGDKQWIDTGKMNMTILDYDRTIGFQFEYLNGSSTHQCNTTTRTLAFFQCSPEATWDPFDNNVTRFTDGFFGNPSDECLFFLNLNYSGACVHDKPVYPQLCQLDNYDLQTLTQPTDWYASVGNNLCVNNSKNGQPCNLIFSFCKEIPHGQCSHSSFCEVGQNTVSFGGFNEHLIVVENDDGYGFTISYFNGTKTANCPGGFHSTLVFTCNNLSIWDNDGDPNITKFIMAEPTFQDCEYIVRFNYSGACPLKPFTPSPTSPPTESYFEQNSIVGAVLIALLVGVAALYLGIGAMVQVIRGRRGIEIVPNVNFWKTFFTYVLDGFQFTLDVITCFKLKDKTITFKSKTTEYEQL